MWTGTFLYQHIFTYLILLRTRSITNNVSDHKLEYGYRLLSRDASYPRDATTVTCFPKTFKNCYGLNSKLDVDTFLFAFETSHHEAVT